MDKGDLFMKSLFQLLAVMVFAALVASCSDVAFHSQKNSDELRAELPSRNDLCLA